jgi:DNA repair protein RAD5
MRLRQAVCHPLLVLKKPNKKDVQEDVEEEAVELDEEGEVESELKRLVSEYQRGLDLEDGDDGVEAADVDELTDLLEKQHDSFEECPFCLEEKTEVCFMPCRHAGCRTCIMAHMELCEGKDERPRCPTCSQTFAMKDLVSAVRTRPRQNRLVEDGEDDEAPAEDAHSQPSLIFRKTDFRSSTKLEAVSAIGVPRSLTLTSLQLIDDLNELRFAEPGFKVRSVIAHPLRLD